MRSTFCVALALLFATGQALQASDVLWSAAILVATEPEAKPMSKALERYSDILLPVFGGNAYSLLGKTKTEIRHDGPFRLSPAKGVSIKAIVLESLPTAYRIRVEILLEEQLFVSTDVRLARGAPLLIRGPQRGTGQLVFLLEVQ